MQSEIKKPFFFMIDLPLSGSTLMAYILDSHSKIKVEHEDHTRPFHLFYIKNLKLKLARGFEKYLYSLLDKKENLISSRYFDKKQVQWISDSLGDRAKYIILTRKFMWRAFYTINGKPRCISLKRLIHFFICKHYVINNFDYVKISYNEMVSKPKETFSKICHFIGVEFEPEMLKYQNFEHNIKGNPKTRNFRGIVDKSAMERITLNLLLKTLIVRLIYFVINTSNFYRKRRVKKTMIRTYKSKKNRRELTIMSRKIN